MKKLYIIAFAAVVALSFNSCKEDEFTESIFDVNALDVDPNSTTYLFDNWLDSNFVKPFNTKIVYKFDLTGTQLKFQLGPTDYEKSQLMAHFMRYLFYDVYNKYGEKDALGNEIFMRRYGPRIFQFVGTKALSPSTGTETLGYASGGVKITLININQMKMCETDPETGVPTSTFSGADIDDLNRYQFHTMHHEFSHILHQTKTMPVDYGQVTPASYEPRDWEKMDSVEAHTRGFVTHYASSGTSEDFVELLSCNITDPDYRWMTTIIDMCTNSCLMDGDTARVYALIDSLGIGRQKANNIVKQIGGVKLYHEYASEEDRDNQTNAVRDITGFHLADVKAKNDEDSKGMCYDNAAYITYPDFDSFLEAQEINSTGVSKGINAYLKKLEIATKWYTEEWGFYLFKLRQEVRERQNHLNDYLKTFQIYKLG